MTKNPILRRWAEVLHLREGQAVPKTAAQVKWEKYEMVGSFLPMQEFSTSGEYGTVADVLGFLLAAVVDELRPWRAFAPGDVVVLHGSSSRCSSVCVATFEEHQEAFMSQHSKVAGVDGELLRLVSLPGAGFPSFVLKHTDHDE